MPNMKQLLYLANFLGEDITEEQATRLMDEARGLSIAEKQELLARLDGGPMYTEMSMHDAEMGGLTNY